MTLGLKPGQHARGVIVEEQFAAEFEVELAVGVLHAVENGRALLFEIPFVVETLLYRHGWLFGDATCIPAEKKAHHLISRWYSWSDFTAARPLRNSSMPTTEAFAAAVVVR